MERSGELALTISSLTACLSCCCLVCVVICWEKGWPIGSLVCDVLLCFVTFPCSVLGQVWYLNVSIPDLLTWLNKEKVYLINEARKYFIGVVIITQVTHVRNKKK